MEIVARRWLGSHYSETIGHPSTYLAVATYSLPLENGDDQEAVLNQLKHKLGYPEGVRYNLCRQYMSMFMNKMNF